MSCLSYSFYVFYGFLSIFLDNPCASFKLLMISSSSKIFSKASNTKRFGLDEEFHWRWCFRPSHVCDIKVIDLDRCGFVDHLSWYKFTNLLPHAVDGELSGCLCCLLFFGRRKGSWPSCWEDFSPSRNTSSVRSINRTWIAFKLGTCFMDEQEGPCSPAKTSQVISVSVILKCFIQASFILSIDISPYSSKLTNSLAPIREYFWAFPVTSTLNRCTTIVSCSFLASVFVSLAVYSSFFVEIAAIYPPYLLSHTVRHVEICQTCKLRKTYVERHDGLWQR